MNSRRYFKVQIIKANKKYWYYDETYVGKKYKVSMRQNDNTKYFLAYDPQNPSDRGLWIHSDDCEPTFYFNLDLKNKKEVIII